MKLVDADSLVRRARSGDSSARDRLVRDHYGAVWSLARKLVRDDATASDVAQDTFLRAFAHLDQYWRGRGASAWMHAVKLS